MTPPARSFTVILPDVLRDRFERWLRRNHLMMTWAKDGDVVTRPHVVAPAPNSRRQ
jgi:hypothetical protein